jgi:hypothetical protein
MGLYSSAFLESGKFVLFRVGVVCKMEPLFKYILWNGFNKVQVCVCVCVYMSVYAYICIHTCYMYAQYIHICT